MSGDSGSETPVISVAGSSAAPTPDLTNVPFSPDTPIRTGSSLRNEIASPTSPGSDYDSPSATDSVAPSILASKLGRSLHGAAFGSSLSLSGSGISTPNLSLTGFNAISTVLNNPSKRQHPIDPKSSRFPPVNPTPHVLSDIPKAKKSDVDSYLSSVRPEWDRFMRNQRIGRQGKASVGEADGQSQEASTSHPPNIRSHRSRGSVASLSAELRAAPSPASQKRLPPLSAVPQVFFSEEFDLGNPYTFDLVTERYKLTTQSVESESKDPNGGAVAERSGAVSPHYDVALNQMLQEKLSYYSDVIEQHLIIEIGQQSSSFFAALGNLKELNAEAENCLAKIDELKVELDTIDEGQAKKGLRVLVEQDRRRKIQADQQLVESIKKVVERRDLIHLLVQQGETEEALEMINGLRAALQGAPSDLFESGIPPIRFSELQSLSFIMPQLAEMEASLAGSLQQDLLDILAQDIAARVRQSHADDQQATDGPGTEDDYFSRRLSIATAAALPMQNGLSPGGGQPAGAAPKRPLSPYGNRSRPLSSPDAQLQTRIMPLVVGLARTGGMSEAASAYREVALQAIKDVWRLQLGKDGAQMAELAALLETEDPIKGDDDLDNLPPLLASFRDLSLDEFLSRSRRLFDALLECLRAIDSQSKLILRILDEFHHSLSGSTSPSAEGQAPTMPDGVSPGLPASMADVVVGSAELSHVLSRRLLSIRAGVHTTLELAPFLAVFQLCWSYVLSSEVICRKMVVGLRGSVLSQAKGFLSNFHRKRIERAAKAVEEETWAQSDVGSAVQHEVKLIVDSAVEDPAEFVVTGEASSARAEGDPAKPADDTERAKALDIEDRSFFVVAASLDVLDLLAEYLRVIINLPLLTTEAMGRLVEFLKQFNSRTCQVVLGAGAMRSAGLKNITAKHLALASQSLSIMISLIPYIRETVRRHLSPTQAVMLTEFDKLRRDFQEHQYEIHAKLVAIMSDRLTVHCRSMGNVEWNAPGPEDRNTLEANKYATDLVKETATLHKVLSKYLQVSTVEAVIGQVLRSIDQRISAEIDKIEVQTQSARDRIEEDVNYLEKKLSTLKNVEWKGEGLMAALERKKVPPPAPPAEQTEQRQQQTVADPPAYKPRITSLFARRQQQQIQQQQQQQQQQEAGVARSSVDSASPTLNASARQSMEAFPRSSLQEVATPPVPDKDPTAANGNGSAAAATPRASEDQPPSVPVKAADSSTEAEPVPPETRDSDATPATRPSTDSATPVASATTEAEANGSVAATEAAKATITSKSIAEEQEQVSEASSEPAQSEPKASLDGAKPVVPESTPATASSPILSGTTTPASPAGTPTRPGRLSLKERLAEAARKRMAAQQVNTAPPVVTEEKHKEDQRAAESVSGPSASAESQEKSDADAEVATPQATTKAEEQKGTEDAEPAADVQTETKQSAAVAAAASEGEATTSTPPAEATEGADAEVAIAADEAGKEAEVQADVTSAEPAARVEDNTTTETESELVEQQTEAQPTTQGNDKLNSAADAPTEDAEPPAASEATEKAEVSIPALETGDDEKDGDEATDAQAQARNDPIEETAAQAGDDREAAKTEQDLAAATPTISGTNTPDLNGSVNGDGEGEDGEDDGADETANATSGAPGGGNGGGGAKRKKKKNKGKKKKK